MTSARRAAGQVLVALDRGRTTLAAEIDRVRPQIPDRRDRGLFLEITSGAIRWRNELDAWLAVCSRRPIDALAPEVRAVLRLAAYQLLHLERVPAHAVLNESVEVVRALGQPRSAGFVNAVLRALLRRRPHSPLPPRPGSAPKDDAARKYLSVTLSHPDWLVGRWLKRHGFDDVERWCRFNNSPPELTVRPGRRPAEEWLAELHAEGVETKPARFVRNAIRLPAGALSRMPADVAEILAIQDEASQLVAHLVGANRGERILDVCAAPGGKTVILCDAVYPDGLVVAGDHRPFRMALLRSTLDRGGARGLLTAFDAARALPFGPVFDRVLLDAPCSGLGTLRRDPDLKWSRQEADLLPLAAVQRRMLGQAATTVRPGGSLVYSTCSSEPEENEDVVDAFLSGHREFSLGPLDAASADYDASSLIDGRGFLRTLPFRDGLDAFFAARLVRQQTA